MTAGTIALWALLLMLQNAAFTWVGRARTGGSDAYHAVASVFSNGIWFGALLLTFEGFDAIKASGSVSLAVGLGVVYVVTTATGSVTAGWFLRTHVEKGKRRVGHYEQVPVFTASASPEEARAWARTLTGPGSAIYRIDGPEAAAAAQRRTLRKIDYAEYVRDREARARRYE